MGILVSLKDLSGLYFWILCLLPHLLVDIIMFRLSYAYRGRYVTHSEVWGDGRVVWWEALGYDLLLESMFGGTATDVGMIWDDSE